MIWPLAPLYPRGAGAGAGAGLHPTQAGQENTGKHRQFIACMLIRGAIAHSFKYRYPRVCVHRHNTMQRLVTR